jgi:ABC-2 type transport system ATP-binding protein
LTKRYGDLVAVDGLTLDVREGEVFGFLGPNGAGKTTSINMMCGLLKPDAGRVLLKGASLAGDADARSRVGVCPQEIVLWDRLTCIEQLQFIGEMYDVPARESRKRAVRLLTDLGLEEKRDKQARTLSGGLKRRLNMAMALVHDPEVVILDEPEAGLDPQSRVRVREYIRELARTRTLILTTHNMDEAERLADRVAIIDHGRLLVLDTPEALKRATGEGDIIEIRPAREGDAQSALLALQGLVGGAASLAEDGAVVVRAPDGVRLLPQIADVLEAIGVTASDMRLRQSTLEDVFIALTGRRLRE